RHDAAKQGYRFARLIDDRLRRACRHLGPLGIDERHARILKDGARAALRPTALVLAGEQIVIYAVVDLLNEVDRLLCRALADDFENGRRGRRSRRWRGRRRGGRFGSLRIAARERGQPAERYGNEASHESSIVGPLLPPGAA